MSGAVGGRPPASPVSRGHQCCAPIPPDPSVPADAGDRSRSSAGWPVAATTGGVVFIDLRDSTVSFRSCSATRPSPRRRSSARRVLRPCRRRRGRSVPRAQRERRAGVGCDRDQRDRARGPQRRRAAAVPARRDTRRGGASSTAISTCVARAREGPATAVQGQRRGPRRARRARLRRDRDADADAVDSRGGPRLPRPRPSTAGVVLRTPAESAVFKQLLMVAGMERYYRSRAATATRTSEPTGSPSSPSSTSR